VVACLLGAMGARQRLPGDVSANHGGAILIDSPVKERLMAKQTTA
jgi:hypothetical protein